MKYCTKCNTNKPTQEFNRKGKGYQYCCRRCQSDAYRLKYYGNHEAERNRLTATNVAYRDSIKANVREAKNKSCMDCGIKYPYYVMDFDHRPEETKLFHIGAAVGKKSLSAILDEITKCDVVCSNCHRERSHSRLV